MTSLSPAGTAKVLAPLVLGVLAAWGILVLASQPGWPGTHSDGVEYVEAAASLAERGTLEIPVTHWSDADSLTVLSHYPPGFSAVVAGVMRVGSVGSQEAVTWVLAGGAGISAALLMALGVALAGWGPGLLAVALAVATPALVFLHVRVWSEALFVPVVLLALWLMASRPSRSFLHGWVALAALVLRYVGISVAAAAALLAWRQGGSLRRRMARVAAAAGPSLLFLVGWKGFVDSGDEVIRSVRLYPGVVGQLLDFVGLLVDWLVPLRARGGGGLGVVLVLVVAGGLGVLLLGPPWVRTRSAGAAAPDRAAGYARILADFSLAYLGVVILSRALVDPLIPFDTRLFAPVLVAVTLLFAVRMVEILRVAGPAGRVALATPLALWILAGVEEVAQVERRSPSYYTSSMTAADPVIRRAALESREYRYLYANEAALLVHLGGRPAKHLLRSHEEPDAFRAAFALRPGPILVVRPDTKDTPDLEELAGALGIRLVESSALADLYLPMEPIRPRRPR